MSTLAQMVTAVRDEIQESTAGLWSDAEIKRWLNRAHFDLTDAARLEGGPTTVTTAANDEDYSLPADFGGVRKLEIVDSSDSTMYETLEPATPDDRMDSTGQPHSYYVYNDLLYVIPKADAVYSLRLWYHKRATALSADGDEPIIPDEFHDLIVDYAIARAKQKDDDPAYQTYDSRYDAGKADMVRKLSDRGRDERYAQVVDYPY